MLYVKNNNHVFWQAFKANIELFSTEDLENLHSKLSLLMHRMADKSNNDGIQERFRLLPETQRIEQLVDNLYGTKERKHTEDKRRSGKQVPVDSAIVKKSYAYIYLTC